MSYTISYYSFGFLMIYLSTQPHSLFCGSLFCCHNGHKLAKFRLIVTLKDAARIDACNLHIDIHSTAFLTSKQENILEGVRLQKFMTGHLTL